VSSSEAVGAIADCCGEFGEPLAPDWSRSGIHPRTAEEAAGQLTTVTLTLCQPVEPSGAIEARSAVWV
jgi:hypothetical protein